MECVYVRACVRTRVCKPFLFCHFELARAVHIHVPLNDRNRRRARVIERTLFRFGVVVVRKTGYPRAFSDGEGVTTKRIRIERSKIIPTPTTAGTRRDDLLRR